MAALSTSTYGKPSQPVVIIHLVMDDDHGRMACTGEQWQHPGDSDPKVPRQLCGACQRLDR